MHVRITIQELSEGFGIFPFEIYPPEYFFVFYVNQLITWHFIGRDSDMVKNGPMGIFLCPNCIILPILMDLPSLQIITYYESLTHT